MWCAIVVATNGGWSSLFSVFIAMICGIGTYNPRAQKQFNDRNKQK